MDTKQKIVNLKVLRKRITHLRKKGWKIAFTNGCFDLLHLGHVSYLEKAKKNNRILIVGLNSDQSIRKIKDPKRPILFQKERAVILASLACVDFVTIFNEETPLKLIEAVKPDILIKGADWKRKEAVGSDVVKGYGARVEYIRYIPGFSTTRIIEKIVQKCTP